MTPEQRHRILSRLNGRNQVEAFEAAKAIWEDSDELIERPLVETLRSGHRAFNRAAAAYAMQMVTTPRTVAALEKTAKDDSEYGRVRGEAIEALAHHHRRKSHNILLTLLDDPSKDVRFWCAFALSEMAEPRAIALLRHLVASDKRIVKGFHSVSKEAADAIKKIESKNKDHRRKTGCVFCAD